MSHIISEDRFAVAIKKAGSVVGHVSFNLVLLVSAILRKYDNKGLVEVAGTPKINNDAGYGVEVPCMFHLYRAKYFIKKLKELVYALCTDGHI